ALQDLRHQGSVRDHQLGDARGRQRAELSEFVIVWQNNSVRAELPLLLRRSAQFSSRLSLRAELPLLLRRSGSPFFACAKKGNRKKAHPQRRALRASCPAGA